MTTRFQQSRSSHRHQAKLTCMGLTKPDCLTWRTQLRLDYPLNKTAFTRKAVIWMRPCTHQAFAKAAASPQILLKYQIQVITGG